MGEKMERVSWPIAGNHRVEVITPFKAHVFDRGGKHVYTIEPSGSTERDSSWSLVLPDLDDDVIASANAPNIRLAISKLESKIV